MLLSRALTFSGHTGRVDEASDSCTRFFLLVTNATAVDALMTDTSVLSKERTNLQLSISSDP